MDRRTFLRSGVLTAGFVALSGCSASESGDEPTEGDEDETATDPGTATETASENTATADARLRAASTLLTSNNDQFSRFVDRVERDTDEPVTFDRATVADRLDGVRRDLDAAAERGDQSQQDTVTHLRALADVQVDAADGFDAFAAASVTWNEDVDAAVEREAFGRAASELDGLEAPVDRALTALEAATDGLDDVDATVLADVSVEVGPLESAVETISDRTNAVRDLVGVMRPYFEGTELFIDGLGSYQNRQFGAAASTLSRAESKFGVASSRVATVEPPESDLDAVRSLSEIRCMSDAFAAGADYYERSADAYAAGNDRRGQNLAEQAQQALNRCESTESDSTAI